MTGHESKFSIHSNGSQLTYDLLFDELQQWGLSMMVNPGKALFAFSCNDTIIETGEKDDEF
jgi:hypothetical protein